MKIRFDLSGLNENPDSGDALLLAILGAAAVVLLSKNNKVSITGAKKRAKLADQSVSGSRSVVTLRKQSDGSYA
jgi:hypothetical protein